MLHRLEQISNRRAYALSRAVGSDELRLGFLKLLKLFQQRVVLCVGDRRSIQDVVPMGMLPDLGAELLDLGGCFGHLP